MKGTHYSRLVLLQSELKAEQEGDIVVHGSARLVQTLLDHDLVDELRLMVFPVVLGRGLKLFGETGGKKKLRLTGSKVVGDGVTILVYEPAREAAEAGCELVMPHKSQITDALATRVRAVSLKLATWVVDDPEELRALARFELYGVGSNCPGLLLDAIAEGILTSPPAPRP